MTLVVRMLLPLLLSFLVGVFCASFFAFSFPITLLLLLSSFAICCALAFSSERTHFMMFVVCVFGVALGIARFGLWQAAPRDTLLTRALGTTVELTGVVDSEPDVREGNTHLTIKLRLIKEASSSQSVHGNLLLIAARYPEYQYGDVIIVRGKLEEPKAFTGDDGRVFDYPKYLASKGITYQMSFATINRVGRGEGKIILQTLLHLKSRFTQALTHALPEPHGALMGGLLLGEKQSLGSAWTERFRTVGIIHIVVLSGYNMTIVATWLVIAFRFMGFLGSLSMGGVGIVLFTLMTGGGATVLRAALMALLALIARATGRTYAMSRALLLAGVLMVLQNPSILAFDPSFQLSFLASLGLIVVAPIIEKKVAFWKDFPSLREVLISTIATQVMVLPLLLHKTGVLSLVALPVNVLVLPIIPLTMLFGFIAGVVSLIFPSLAFIAGFPAFVLLSFVLNVADYSSRLPFAALHLPAISPMITLLAYALLALWIYRVGATACPLSQSHPERPLRSTCDRK